jgi:nucleoside-diphosphate-sugar epimerase
MTPADPGRILVTGGAGFLGTAVVADLLARGHQVRCLLRSEKAAAHLRRALGAGGVDTTRLELAFGSIRPDGVDPGWLLECDRLVHAAGALDGAPSTLVRQNVAATRTLAETAAACGITRLILVSSLSVYDTHVLEPGAVLDEGCPIEPAPERRGAYVYSKVAQERVCTAACRHGGVPLVIVRPGVIFGPGRNCLTERVGLRLGHFIALIQPDRPLPYVFVANCAAAVALAASRDCADGEVFNVVDDQLPTGRQLVAACRAAGRDLRAVAVPGWATRPLSRAYGWCYRRSDGLLPPSFVPYVADAIYKPLRFSNHKAKTRLRWQPRVKLESALQQTLASA